MNLIKRTIIILFAASLIMYCGHRLLQNIGNDKKAPLITFDSDSISVSVTASDEELLKGVTASDDKDGDVTSSLIIEKISKLIGENKRIITYAAFDSNNNVSKAARELVYTDYYPPRFSLKAPLAYSFGSYIDILENIEAYDCIDGDISHKVKASFTTPTAPGVYTATYKVTNSSGDTSVFSAQVNVYEADRNSLGNTPVIVLTDYLVRIKQGDSIDPSSFFQGVTIGNKKYPADYSQMSTTNNVDASKPGIYSILYSITVNGYTGTTELIVMVE